MARKIQQQQQQGASAATVSTENHGHGEVSTSCTEVEVRREADPGSDNDSEVCDLALDGTHEDEILSKSDALTREEVIRRRSRRVKQLMKLYRMQYWGLLEELRSKYRVFYIKHGKGGWRDDIDPDVGDKDKDDPMDYSCSDVPKKSQVQNDGGSGGIMKEPLAPEKSSVCELPRCAFQGCKSKPMALSIYCFAHILLEPRQQLYKPCSFVIRSGGQNGSVTCGKPVLRSVVPSYCAVHMQKSSRSARKAVAASAQKPGPKLHLVIAEYVHVIQSKRRAVRDAASKNITNSLKDSSCLPAPVPKQEQAQSSP